MAFGIYNSGKSILESRANYMKMNLLIEKGTPFLYYFEWRGCGASGRLSKMMNLENPNKKGNYYGRLFTTDSITEPSYRPCVRYCQMLSGQPYQCGNTADWEGKAAVAGSPYFNTVLPNGQLESGSFHYSLFIFLISQSAYSIQQTAMYWKCTWSGEAARIWRIKGGF